MRMHWVLILALIDLPISFSSGVIFSDAWRTMFPFLQEPSNEKLLDKAYQASQSLNMFMFNKYYSEDVNAEKLTILRNAGRYFLTGKINKAKEDSNSQLQVGDFVGQQIVIEKYIDSQSYNASQLLSLSVLAKGLDKMESDGQLGLLISFLVKQGLPSKWIKWARTLRNDIRIAAQLQSDIKNLLYKNSDLLKSLYLPIPIDRQLTSPTPQEGKNLRRAKTERMRLDLRPNGLAHSYSRKTRPLFGSRLLSASQRESLLSTQQRKKILKDAFTATPRKKKSDPIAVPPQGGWGEWNFCEKQQLLSVQLLDGKKRERWRYEANAGVQPRPDGALEIVLRNGKVYQKPKGRFWWEQRGSFKELR